MSRRTRRAEMLDPNNPVEAEKIINWIHNDGAKRRRPWGYHAEIIEAVQNELQRLRAPLENLDVASAEFDQALIALNRLCIERETEAWYIVEVAQLATIVELCVEGGRIWEAVTRSIQIGELLSEMKLKFGWEAFALAGLNQRTHLNDNKRNRLRTKPSARIVDMEAKIAEGHSVRRASQILASKHGVEPRTLEKFFRSEKKKATPGRKGPHPNDS